MLDPVCGRKTEFPQEADGREKEGRAQRESWLIQTVDPGWKPEKLETALEYSNGNLEQPWRNSEEHLKNIWRRLGSILVWT